jgi:hypothetical protein
MDWDRQSEEENVAIGASSGVEREAGAGEAEGLDLDLKVLSKAGNGRLVVLS